MFLGYGYQEFGYRLWDLIDKKIIRSRDVIFLEDQTIEDFDKIEKPKSDGRRYMDVVPKHPSVNFVYGGDIHKNVTNDQEPYHDKQVEEAPP